MANNKLDSGTPISETITSNALENISGIFSIKPMAKYHSGARCILRVNGEIVGFAFNISWNINTQVTEIKTVDDYLPYELAPSRIEVSGSIGGFRIPGSSPTQKFIQSDLLSFLHQRYISIEVRDAQTDDIIFYTQKAMVTSRSETININDLAKMNLQFKAIGWRDERTPKLPGGINDPVDVDGTNQFTKLSDRVRDIFNS